MASFTGKKFILNSLDSYIRDIACYPGYEDWLKELIKKHESNSFFEGKMGFFLRILNSILFGIKIVSGKIFSIIGLISISSLFKV